MRPSPSRKTTIRGSISVAAVGVVGTVGGPLGRIDGDAVTAKVGLCTGSGDGARAIAEAVGWLVGIDSVAVANEGWVLGGWLGSTVGAGVKAVVPTSITWMSLTG